MRGRKRRALQVKEEEEEEGESAAPSTDEPPPPPKKEAKTTKEVVRTVKTSLSHVLVHTDGTYNLLPPLLLYCNQIRVLATLIAKHHLFTLLQAPPHKITFAPNQNYFSHVFTAAQGVSIRDTARMLAPNSYKASLTASATFVLSLFPTPTYEGPLSRSGQAQIFCWFAKQLSENLSTHLKTHAGDVVQNWFKNNLRAEVSRANPQLEKKELQKAIKARRDAMHLGTQTPNENDDLVLQLLVLERDIEEMMESGTIDAKTQQLIGAFYALQRDVGALEDIHGVSPKLFSVVPEANIAISPITICSRVMLHLCNAINRGKEEKMPKKSKEPKRRGAEVPEPPPIAVDSRPPKRHDEADASNWDALFDMDEVNKLRNAPWTFAGSVMTDGVALWVRFFKDVPKAEFLERGEFLERRVDLGQPGLYSELNTMDEEQLRNANLVGLDPGIAAVVTAVRLADVDHNTLRLKEGCEPLRVSQAQYKEESMLRYKLKKSGVLKCKPNKKRGRKVRGGRAKRWRRRRKKERVRKSYAHKVHLKDSTEILQNAPSPKRVEVAKFVEYLKALASVWEEMWAYHGAVKRRKVNFFVYRRRERFMNRLVRSFKKCFGANPVILFGNGADNGLFGRLRGGGVKGPVKEIKRRLSEHYAVISCSEYRSSKLCIHCGRELHVHKHGVVYCAQQSHNSMLNRDVAAAIKIGAIFLAKKSGADLGPWAWGSTVADHTPSRALASAIIGHAA